jgi:putative glutamine amidotransferase
MRLCQAIYEGEDPFAIFASTFGATSPDQLDKDCALLLHGGEDISPSIYNEKTNSHCFARDTPSKRDRVEIAFVTRALELNIPIIGICRGAQLICAMDGGSLVQHIVGHVGGNHPITIVDTHEKIKANSAHHQMLRLNRKHKNILIAISEDPVKGVGENDVVREYDHVPEIVYFPKMNALGIQGHPEWMPNSEFTKYCASLIQKYLLKKD